jgi:hypothetical protein
MKNWPKPELAETSARIADAMARHNLSPRQITEALGHRERDPRNANIYNWARGKNAPSSQFREKLAKLLGLKTEDLVPEGRPRTMSRAEKLARKRESNQKYRQARLEQNSKPGPAEQAVMLYSDNRPEPVPVSRVPAPRPEDVFTTAIRSDGTMQVRLNLTLPIAEGIALVQMLYAADALRSVREQTTTE